MWINANPLLSEAGAAMKFEFCMLKNTAQADFLLKISTPGIVAANGRSRNKFSKYNTSVNGFQKLFFIAVRHEKTDVSL